MLTKLNSSGTSLTTREYDEVIAEVYVTTIENICRSGIKVGQQLRMWPECSCLDQSFVLLTEEWKFFEKTNPVL